MTYKKKLIEVGLPLEKINFEAAKDKGIRNHPQAMHRWWARRPLAAARAVLFAQLVDDPSAHPEKFPTEEDQQLERSRLFDIIERLVPWEASNDEAILAEARAEIIKSCDGDLPKFLDPFAGGGAIPLEALRLGLPTYSGDLNPVAVLIQRAMLEIPHRFANRPAVHLDVRDSKAFWRGTEGLAADVKAYGEWMQAEARARIGKYYPDAILPDGTSATPIAWIWARTVESPDPAWSGHVPLAKSWELSKKPGKPRIWIEPVVDRDTHTILYEIRSGGSPSAPVIDRGNTRCVATGTAVSNAYIRSESLGGRMASTLIAIVAEGQNGREYVAGSADAEPTVLPDPSWRPDIPMDKGDSNLVSGRGYRFDTWTDLFTTRQLLALTTFSDLLVDVRTRIENDAVHLPDDGVHLRDGGYGRTAYADAITTYLALAISKTTDFNSTIATWDSTNVKIRNTFARQAIPMTWDFAEANILGDAVGSFYSMVKGVCAAVASLPAADADVKVAQRDARARISEVGQCVVATDPPYYDNISYAGLSDFFYVWLRRNLADVWADECSTLLTPKVDELIASRHRAGSAAAAKMHFELGMQGVFEMASKHADERFPATVFYAYKATEETDSGVLVTGWETFLAGLLDAGYSITGTWPIRTEKPGRMIAIGNAALATSIVLVIRRRHVAAPLATRGEFVACLRNEMPPAIRSLQLENIAPVDMAQSAIGPGIAVFSRYTKVVEADGSPMTVRTALQLINEVLSEVLTGEEGEFDADTRFALTWFEQYGLNPGPFGDADLLATAKGTTVSGVELSGVVLSRGGRVNLVERANLPEEWDPASDTRLTVWETTQYLIRDLESSEAEAAARLRRIGIGRGERARQLAYLLYGICDRKKWSAEAVIYNMLVTAWPELVKLAGSGNGSADADPESLF